MRGVIASVAALFAACIAKLCDAPLDARGDIGGGGGCRGAEGGAGGAVGGGGAETGGGGGADGAGEDGFREPGGGGGFLPIGGGGPRVEIEDMGL